MYLYFNSQGVLKEIVNDEAIRQGNASINKIKFFIEGADPQVVEGVYKALTFITGVRTFVDVLGQQLTTEAFSLTTVEDEIPYNKKRELKFFKYFTKYEMFSITVPEEVLVRNGTVGCRVQMVSAEGIITLGLILFNVEGTGSDATISPDTAINVAQYNYLIRNMTTPERFLMKYDAETNDWDVVPTNGSTKPVTSGGVFTAIANALSAVYKIQGSATVQELEDLIQSASLNGYVYNLLDGGTLLNYDDTTVSVQEGDNVVFVWNDGDWYWDKLGGFVDTSGLASKNELSFRVYDAPSNTLVFTDDMIASLKYGGIVINGQLYGLNVYNPILSKGTFTSTNDILGMVIYSAQANGELQEIAMYRIPQNTKQFSITTYNWINLKNIKSVDFGNNAKIIKDGSNRVVIQYNGNDKIKVGNTETYFANHVEPDTNDNYDLGRSGMYWRKAFIKNIIDANNRTIPTTDIVTQPDYANPDVFEEGTLNASGQGTIDMTETGTPMDGLYMFTYGNCQCFLTLTSAMITNAFHNPIRCPCPTMYNGSAYPGVLKIERSGDILTLTVATAGVGNVTPAGFGWKLIKVM